MGHDNLLLLLGLGATNLPIALGLGNLDFCVVDGAGGGFLTQSLNVAALIRDVLNVHVDELEAHFLQFHFDPAADVLYEFIAVRVDLLNGHRRENHAHLAEDDVLGQFADGLVGESQHAFGGVFHRARLGGDPDREGGGRVDADVLLGQGTSQLDVDRNRDEIEELVVLDHRPDEGGAAMYAPGAQPFADLAVHHQYLVRGAPLEACCEDPQGGQHEEGDTANKEQQREIGCGGHEKDVRMVAS